MDDQSLYDLVLGAPQRERAALVESICRRNPDLRERLERLLAVDSILSVDADPTGSASAPPRTSREGRVLANRYRIVEWIGAGGMGEVFLADDLRLKSRVALKFLKRTSDQAADARFRREARIAANLQHRDLCPVVDLGDADGEVFLVMPYIEGDTLARRIARRGRLDAGQALMVARRIAVAMEAAHRAGIVHRDLKPGNIILRQDPLDAPMVMDFGLARRFNSSDGELTREGAAVGTPRYMAPEQARGSVVRPAADVFSLGAVLLEMVAGDAALEDRTLLLENRRMSPQSASPDLGVPDAVVGICRKALERRPEDRFASMEEFVAAIDRASSKVLPSNSSLHSTVDDLDFLPSTVVANPGPVRRSIVPAAAVCIVAVAVVAWFAATRVFGPGAAPRTESAVSESELSRALRPGATWKGTYRFRAASGKTEEQLDKSGLRPGDVAFSIVEREGDRFTGTYETLHGAYAWKVAGVIANGRLDAAFTSSVREPKPMQVVGLARLRGMLKAGRLELVFDDGPDTADMELLLEQ